MSRVLRPDYSQRFLLPPSLEDWVPPTHPVRFVRDFVDALDLSELGIEEPEAKEGRPPYAPDLLLKVWLFGYMERIRSTRGLEKACLQVMPFLWLTGNLHPDHMTLWRFFQKNRDALPKLFRQLVRTAAKAELVGFVLHALDGTKVTAASSTDTAAHRKALDDKLKLLDELIAAYMREVTTQAEADKGKGYAMPAELAEGAARFAKILALLERRLEDREDERVLAKQQDAKEDKKKTNGSEPPSPPPDTGGGGTTEPPPAAAEKSTEPTTKRVENPLLAEAQALKQELEGKLAKLDKAGVDHLHEGEPEARMMKGRGTKALGYNAQVVADHDSGLMVACDVATEQNDLLQLVPMLEQARETLGRAADTSVADTGYANGDQLKDAEERALNVLVPLREEPDAKGAYSKAYFRYDEAHNVYVCPQGKTLLHVGSNKSHSTTQHPDAIYRCHDKTCPVRADCTKDPLGRKIRRTYGEEARERQAQKQRDPRAAVLLSLRKEIIEHLFGIVKGIDGFRRFTVRGLEKVRAQWALVCTTVNLRKLYPAWRQGALAFGTPKQPPPAPLEAAST